MENVQESPLKSLPEIQQSIYEAAIMDGEGSIGFGIRLKNSQKMYMTPIVQVSNTFEPLCRYFQEKYGGRVWVNKDKRPTRKTLYLWSVAGQKAINVLNTVYPYLWLKKRQADLVFEFYIGKTNTSIRGIDADEVKRRLTIYTAMKELNHRGALVQ